MSEKCLHETTIEREQYGGFTVQRCTWQCRQDLIQLDLGNHTVATYTAAELAQLREDLQIQQETNVMLGKTTWDLRAELSRQAAELDALRANLRELVAARNEQQKAIEVARVVIERVEKLTAGSWFEMNNQCRAVLERLQK